MIRHRRPSSRLLPWGASGLTTCLAACAFASPPAGRAPAPAPTVRVVDCAGRLADIAVDSGTLLAQRSLADLLPQASAGAATCLVVNPRAVGDRLVFDTPANAAVDPTGRRYRTAELDAGNGAPRLASDEHADPAAPPLRPLLDAAVATPAGKDLLPFSRPGADGGRTVPAGEADRAGQFGLLRLLDAPPASTAFAVVDAQAGSVRVVSGAPLAHARQLHLSQTGRAVLVEEVQGTADDVARTGRIAVFDAGTGRVLQDRRLPGAVARRRDLRVLCFADDASVVVLGSRAAGRVWLVRADGMSTLELANDVSSRCFLATRN